MRIAPNNISFVEKRIQAFLLRKLGGVKMNLVVLHKLIFRFADLNKPAIAFIYYLNTLRNGLNVIFATDL